MEEQTKTSLSEVEKSEGKWLDRIIVIAAVVIAIAAISIFIGKKSGKKTQQSAIQQLEQVQPDYSFILDNMDGSYDLKMTGADGEQIHGVARIKYNDIEGYDLILYSEYSPVTYHFKSTGGANLHSEELGDGVIDYEKDFETTTITFKKENSTCVLSR